MQERMEASFGTLVCALLDRRSSVPLAGTRVMCIGRDQQVRVLTADAQGRLRAELPEGVYDLVISARGYLSLTVRGVGVLAGHQQDLTRALVPGEGGGMETEQATAIAGVVRDRIGQAVADVQIHVNETGGSTAYTTHTDRTGAFLVHGVPPGMYDLIARSGERRLALEHVPIFNVRDLVRVDLRLVQV